MSAKSTNASWRSTLLNLKKNADTVEVGDIQLGICTACQGYVSHIYFMSDKQTNKKSKWFSCSCGVVFNTQKPYGKYDMEYWKKRGLTYDKKLETSYAYPVRIYAPIIEELVYKRRVLLVGYPNSYQADAFEARGWVTHSIDKNTSFKDSHNLIADDFETHQFPETIKYDLIWIYHTLKCLSDPIGSLAVLPKLLAEGGTVYIGDADTDFINTRSSSCFIHWNPEWNNVMWNKRAITKQMESLGFNTIMCRSNHYDRFPHHDDFHGIWQKRYF
jgi:hypothetical protein